MLWFGLAGRDGYSAAAYRWDGTHLDLVRLSDIVCPRPCSIDQIVPDNCGNLWFGGIGLYRYDGKTFHCTAEPFGPIESICSLLPRSDGSLWIGTIQGLFVYRNGHFELLGEELADCWVRALLEDPSGAVWVGLPGVLPGSRVMRYEDGEFRLIRQLNAGLWGNLCLDQAGRLWIGSSGNGLYCYDATRFQVFPKEHQQ